MAFTRGEEDRFRMWDHPSPDVCSYPNPKGPAPLDREQNKQEITRYFEERRERRNIVATTETPRGQLIDWIAIESQVARGTIASPQISIGSSIPFNK